MVRADVKGGWLSCSDCKGGTINGTWAMFPSRFQVKLPEMMLKQIQFQENSFRRLFHLLLYLNSIIHYGWVLYDKETGRTKQSLDRYWLANIYLCFNRNTYKSTVGAYEQKRWYSNLKKVNKLLTCLRHCIPSRTGWLKHHIFKTYCAIVKKQW